MKRLIVAVAIIGMWGSTTATAVETRVQLKGCEFTVTLPEKPIMRAGRKVAAGTTASSASNVAEIRTSVPAFRIECQALSRLPPSADKALMTSAETQADSMSLSNLNITREKTRLGHIVRFTGGQVQAQRKLVVTGVFFLGDRSILSVLATEFEDGYPLNEVVRVFKSVSR
jgi:hypothetical protein